MVGRATRVRFRGAREQGSAALALSRPVLRRGNRTSLQRQPVLSPSRLAAISSPDSLLTADHSNLYLYALDNPATFTDPSGRLIPVILGAIILGGFIAANYKMWSNVAQNKPHDAGEVLETAGKGMLVATVGVAAVALGAPALAVGVVMMAFPAVMAAIEAPEGQAWEACQDNLPIVAAIRQAERDMTTRTPRIS